MNSRKRQIASCCEDRKVSPVQQVSATEIAQMTKPSLSHTWIILSLFLVTAVSSNEENPQTSPSFWFRKQLPENFESESNFYLSSPQDPPSSANLGEIPESLQEDDPEMVKRAFSLWMGVSPAGRKGDSRYQHLRGTITQADDRLRPYGLPLRWGR